MDATTGVVVRCTGGPDIGQRGGGLCEESFYVPDRNFLVNASLSSADAVDAGEFKRRLENILLSFIVARARTH